MTLKISKKETLGRVKGAHQAVYLTLISIIQGVVFGYIAIVILTNQINLSAVGWVLAMTTILGQVSTWHEYVMGAMFFAWIPDFLDASIPFALGYSSFYLISLIPDETGKWFLASAIYAVFGFIAFVNMFIKVNVFSRGGAFTIKSIRIHIIVSLLFPILATISLFVFWILLQSNFSRLMFMLFSIVALLTITLFAIHRWIYWKILIRHLIQD